MPDCNGRDRGSDFALPDGGAHFRSRCDWTTTSRQTLTEAQFTMGNSMLLQASFGSVLVSGKSLHRRIVQVRRADFMSFRVIASLGAFVMLEPYTVKVVRTVLRGERAVRP